MTAAEVAAFIAGLKSCLMALPSLERDFLIYRAGLDGGGVRSRTASSRALGIAPARGRAVEQRALGRLRSAAASGECGATRGDAFAAGLFVSPTLMSPLGTLLAPVHGVQPVGSKKAAATPAGYRSRPSLGETLRRPRRGRQRPRASVGCGDHHVVPFRVGCSPYAGDPALDLIRPALASERRRDAVS